MLGTSLTFQQPYGAISISVINSPAARVKSSVQTQEPPKNKTKKQPPPKTIKTALLYRKHCSERWSDSSTVTQLEVVLGGLNPAHLSK
jgi:hypothetical protein